MRKIKTWEERALAHPDHEGIVTNNMIHARMQEEIDELRLELERVNNPTSEMLKAGIKAFQSTKNSIFLSDWKNFYKAVINHDSKIGYLGNINGPGCDPDTL